jgi:hypothetical protein
MPRAADDASHRRENHEATERSAMILSDRKMAYAAVSAISSTGVTVTWPPATFRVFSW